MTDIMIFSLELAVLAILFFVLVFLLWSFRNLEDEAVDEYDPNEYSKARAAYLQAQENFNQADPQYVDIAISDLGISENRVDNELRKLKNDKERW